MTTNKTARHGVRASAAAVLMVISGAAGAADIGVPPAQDVPEAPVAAEQSPWQVRLRALGVITENAGHVDGIDGSDLGFSDSVVPELDISYYFTPNIAVELILGTTWSDVETDGSIDALGDVGTTWVLPPTLTLQYHFTNFGAFKPYVGAGVNYTIFYGESDDGAFSDFEVDDAFGWALQAGFDYMFDEHWGINVDVKKIFLETDWSADLGGTHLTGEADLDPWFVGAGVTYRF